ncbi:MAG: DNA mismatch repair endonuclease MutL, partial [Planctomycetota bacterium]
MAIRKLDPHLVNQIAAGEVVERPANVVKELVDNALDAGATRVDVEIDHGGIERIAIRDDGRGIPPADLPLALAAHATSKIQSLDDLHRVATLGFRGEALASIASVCRFTLASTAKQPDGGPGREGARVRCEAGETSPVEPAPARPGTSVEVRDLFYNVPARRRFLKTDRAEAAQVNETLQRLALCWPQVGFRYASNGMTVWDLPPDQSRKQRAAAILGEDLLDGLIEANGLTISNNQEQEVPDAPRAWGLVGEPSLAKATARSLYLSCNGRPIRDRRIQHAVREAFRGLIAPDRWPIGVIEVALDPADVDVNVHPAKAEVRFRKPDAVFSAVRRTLAHALERQDLVARFPAEARLQPAAPEPRPPSLPGFAPPSSASWASALPSHQPTAAAGHSFAPTISPPAAVRHAPLDDPAAGPQIEAQVDVQLDPHLDAQLGAQVDAKALVDYVRRMDPARRDEVYREVRRAQAEDPDTPPAPDQPAAEPAADAPSAPHTTAAPRTPTILQVHDSYVVTQDDRGLLIVDQHALHERVMLERLCQRVFDQNRPLESQRLLVPEPFDADDARLAALEALAPLLARLGIDAGPIGPGRAAVHAFPSLLLSRRVAPGPFLADLADKAASGEIDPGQPGISDEAALHEVLDMMACKAAIKAGDALAPGELEALLQQREAVERSSRCPHGRPTTLRLSLADLAKSFGRSG